MTQSRVRIKSRHSGVRSRGGLLLLWGSVASCSPSVADERVRTSAQTAASTTWVRHVIDDSSRGADGVKLADANGDGRLDIATGWEEGGAVRLYLNPGPKLAQQPWPKVQVGTVRRPEDAVIVDLDGDGRTDVVSATEGADRTLYVHWAQEAGAWKTEAFAATQNTQRWMAILPMDVDRRNGVDLVVGSKEKNAAVGWLESPPNPRDMKAWKYHPFRSATWVMTLAAVDMNVDGFPDVLFSDRKGVGGGVGWLENPGANRGPTSVWKEHRVADASDEEPVTFVTAADLDGDGQLEVVAAYKPSRLAILKRRGPGSWSAEWMDVGGDVGTSKGASVADLNGDRRPDIVMSFEEAKGALTGLIWLEQTPGGWTRHELGGPQGVKYDLVATLDLDGDGDLDVVTTEERDQLGVVWYENPLLRDSGATPAP